MKRITYILAIAATFCTGCSRAESFLDEPLLPDNDAVAFAERLGLGWNLGNQMDAVINGVSGETFWGNPECTQATFDGIKAKGFSTVRIPVSWTGHISEAPGYSIEEAWLERLAEITSYAHKAGLNAIINIHHDGNPEFGWLCVHKAAADQAYRREMTARFTAVWTQVAERFRDEGDWLIFEGYNELQDGNWGGGTNLTDGGKQYSVINDLAQIFVNTVRATGGNNSDRYLALLGYTASPGLTMEHFTLPEDSAKNRLLVSVHCYDPSGYALGQKENYTEWGHGAAADKKDPKHGEEDIVATFKALKEKYIDNNIPVYIGECGAVNRADAKARLFQQYWFRFVARAAKAYGLSPVVWDNGSPALGNEGFGFINHATGAFLSAGAASAIEAMVEAYNGNSKLDEIYGQAPVSAVCCRNGDRLDKTASDLMDRMRRNIEQGVIMYGHQDDLMYGHSWKVEEGETDFLRSDVKDVCGMYPAVYGMDLGGIELGDVQNLDKNYFSAMRASAIAHHLRGGVVTFSWHPRNPLTGGDAWDISSEEVVSSILEGGKCHEVFMQWLCRVADYLESFKTPEGQPVPLIFRPWHEHTGSWFWWGWDLCSADEYKALWKMCFDYLSIERGLHNLIWSYSPGAGGLTEEMFMERWPGDEMVDMIGLDCYQYGTSENYAEELGNILGLLAKIGAERDKMMALTETGYEGIPQKDWWTATLYNAIKDYPLAYVLTWRNACDKAEHFYAPYPGQESAEDFKVFASLDGVGMIK